MATAICSRSSGADMVVCARGAARRAYSLQILLARLSPAFPGEMKRKNMVKK